MYADGNSPVSATLQVAGAGFVPLLVAQQNNGGGLQADKDFKVWLDDTEATSVTWVNPGMLTTSVQGLTAPPSSVRKYKVKVQGPHGEGELADAFVLSTQQPARLTAAATAPARVTSSEAFDVALAVTNQGESRANHVLATLNGVAAVDGEVALDGGASKTFTWHQPAMPRRTADLAPRGQRHRRGRRPCACRTNLGSGPGGCSGRAAGGSAAFASAHLGRPGGLVRRRRHQRGQRDAAGVEVGAKFGAALKVVKKPDAQDIAAGASRTFHFAVTGDQSGAAKPVVTVTGVDAVSGITMTASASWSALTVQTPPALAISAAALPARAAIGQEVAVSLTVKNTGEAVAAAVQPVVQSGTAVVLVAAPAGGALAGGASATFLYRFQAGHDRHCCVHRHGVGAGRELRRHGRRRTLPLGSVAVETPAALSLRSCGTRAGHGRAGLLPDAEGAQLRRSGGGRGSAATDAAGQPAARVVSAGARHRRRR